jgi:GTP-binding protein
MTRPLLAIVGRPNVGKSTLFNRLVGGRPAMVHDTPGLTRDRRYGEFEYFGRHLRLVDTGGLDPEAGKEVIGAGIHRQAHAAISESQAVLFVVDGTAGITPLDKELAQSLRKIGLPIFCIANKIDGPKRDHLINDVFSLGLGEVYAVSAAHGRGVDDLLDALVNELGLEPEPPAPEPLKDDDHDDDGPLRVAFVGKPNAGKSSLLNRLVGSERSLVHHVPGTTTDPVDTELSFGGRDYILVDTAGIRRRARIDEETERISVSMALGQLDRAHVAVLVIDSDEGASEQDARLAGAIADSRCAVVVALNKSDLIDGPAGARKVKGNIDDELHFLEWAPRVMISALRGDGVGALMSAVDRVALERAKRVPTAELNRFFEEVLETHPPPVYRGRPVRIQYLTQGRNKPPTFVLWANRPDGIAPSYRRYIVNQLRSRYGFEGSPVRLVVRAKNEKRGARKSPSGKSRGRRR